MINGEEGAKSFSFYRGFLSYLWQVEPLYYRMSKDMVSDGVSKLFRR